MKKSFSISLVLTFIVFSIQSIFAQNASTQKILKQADELNKKGEYFAEKKIYDELILTDTNNAILYKRRGDANKSWKQTNDALQDYSIALDKIYSKKCNCDFTQYFNQDKKNERCSIKILADIYRSKAEIFENEKKYDSAVRNLSSAVGLFYNANGEYINYPDDYSGASVIDELGFIYYRLANCNISLNRFEDALSAYNKLIELSSKDKDDYARRSDLNFINGNYASAIADLKSAGIEEMDYLDRIENSSLNNPKYFFDYLSSLISLREFDKTNLLFKKYVKEDYNEHTGGFGMQVLLGHYRVGMKPDNSTSGENIDTTSNVYIFFNYFSSVISQIEGENYSKALSIVESLINSYGSKLIQPYSEESSYKAYGDSYLLLSNFLSLKGYLLTKLNRKEEAKKEYEKALKVNPNCKEASEELKALSL